MDEVELLRYRVIPVLLVDNQDLVKTVRFRDPTYVGDPLNAIRIFSEKEADELVLLDIGASREGAGPNFELVREVAGECFMPLAYGGGVQTPQQADELFGLGVEKVVVRSAAMRDPRMLSAISSIGGAQSVALCIDVCRDGRGEPRLHAPRTSMDGSLDWSSVVRSAQELGVGEIIINSVDRDGTGQGLDVELIAAAREKTSLPLVAVGGVGEMRDIAAGVSAGADGVGVGSMFIFQGPRRAVLITYPSYQELADLLGVVHGQG